MDPGELALYFDHTLLRTNASKQDVDQLCKEAEVFGFHAVCVNPFYVPQVVERLEGIGIKVCSVVGFPLGANLMETKAGEASLLRNLGCDEIDMVVNVSALKNKDYDYVREEIKLVRKAVPFAILKVIIEMAYLDKKEVNKVLTILSEEKVDFIKTSTGFGPRPTIFEDVQFLAKHSPSGLKIKASGGIKDLQTTLSFIKAGVHRIGSSSSHKILEEFIATRNLHETDQD